MLQQKLRCITCGKILTGRDDVFVVNTISFDGLEYDSPTCSLECAEKAKETNLEHFRKIVSIIENSEIVKSDVAKYPKAK